MLTVVPSAPVSVSVLVPGVKIVSEMNSRDHWAVRRKRFQAQTDAVLIALRLGVPYSVRVALSRAPRVNVRLVRISGRKMDRDNLAGGFKAVLDAVCDWLAMDDGDEERLGVDWSQETGETGIRIEFTTGDKCATY